MRGRVCGAECAGRGLGGRSPYDFISNVSSLKCRFSCLWRLRFVGRGMACYAVQCVARVGLAGAGRRARARGDTADMTPDLSRADQPPTRARRGAQRAIYTVYITSISRKSGEMHAYTDTHQLLRTRGQLGTRQKPRAYCLCTARCCALKRGGVLLSGAERRGPKNCRRQPVNASPLRQSRGHRCDRITPPEKRYERAWARTFIDAEKR